MISKEELYRKCNSLPKGWKVFLYKMADELYDEIVKSNLKNYHVGQSKEKFGELRWYDYGGNETTDKIIEKYEEESRKVCAICGKPATKTTHGWLLYVCDDCYKEINKG